MPVRKNAGLSLFFALFLLLVVNQVRSGIVVDTSFLPRCLLLALLTGVYTLILFRRTGSLRLMRYDLVFLAFLGWNLLSAAWATVPSEAIAETLLVCLSFAVWVTLRVLLSRDERFERRFIAVALVAMACSFGFAFYKMSKLEFYDPYRILSVSANNNLYAGYLLLCLPTALAGYALFRGLPKYLSALTGVMAVFFIIIVQSRAAYLGLAFASALAVALIAVRYRSLLTRKNVMVALASLLLLAVGIGLFYRSLDDTRRSYFLSKIPVWQYFRSYDKGVEELLEKRRKEKAALTGIPEFDFAGSYYENANLRVIFWKRSATLMARHPWLGTGAGNWRILVPSVPQPENPNHTLRNFTYSQPHNEWIGFLAELGIPGLALALVLFLGSAAMALWRVLKGRRPVPLNALLYAAFLAGFGLYACFDFPFRRVEHNVMFFALTAFLLTSLRGDREEEPRKPSAWRLLRFGLISGLACTVWIVGLRLKGEVNTRILFAYEGKDPGKVIRYGRQAINPCYRITPNALPIDWFIGVAQFRLDSAETANRSFSKALRITPFEVRVLNDHAASLYRLGRTAEAMNELRATLALDPWFDDARFNLAAMHYFNGRSDSALYYVKPCRESAKKKDFLEELRGAAAYPQ